MTATSGSVSGSKLRYDRIRRRGGANRLRLLHRGAETASDAGFSFFRQLQRAELYVSDARREKIAASLALAGDAADNSARAPMTETRSISGDMKQHP